MKLDELISFWEHQYFTFAASKSSIERTIASCGPVERQNYTKNDISAMLAARKSISKELRRERDRLAQRKRRAYLREFRPDLYERDRQKAREYHKRRRDKERRDRELESPTRTSY